MSNLTKELEQLAALEQCHRMLSGLNNNLYTLSSQIKDAIQTTTTTNALTNTWISLMLRSRDRQQDILALTQPFRPTTNNNTNNDSKQLFFASDEYEAMYLNKQQEQQQQQEQEQLHQRQQLQPQQIVDATQSNSEETQRNTTANNNNTITTNITTRKRKGAVNSVSVSPRRPTRQSQQTINNNLQTPINSKRSRHVTTSIEANNNYNDEADNNNQVALNQASRRMSVRTPRSAVKTTSKTSLLASTGPVRRRVQRN